MSSDAKPNDILDATTYYDQSHFIKDFKKHIGLTPIEYIKAQKMTHIYNTSPALNDSIALHSNKQEEFSMNFSEATMRVLVRKDYAACYDFYTEKLGLVVTWGDRNGPYTSFAVKAGEPECLAIFAWANMGMFKGYTQPDSCVQPDTMVGCIPTDDVDADYKRLKVAGVEFVSEPQTMDGWGMRCTYFRDPEGNLFELCQGLGTI